MKEIQSTKQSSDILKQVDDFFMKTGPVHNTLRKVTQRLAKENIDYVIVGGMALALHGFVRPTQDVDLLLTPAGLEDFRKALVGLGYVPLFAGARKHFKDAETGVKIEIITTGEYPGDIRPKPVAFPAPTDAATSIDGCQVLRLENLIELKLASAMSAPHRELRNFADVQQLIATLGLAQDFAMRLDKSVRAQYDRLWNLAQLTRAEENSE